MPKRKGRYPGYSLASKFRLLANYKKIKIVSTSANDESSSDDEPTSFHSETSSNDFTEVESDVKEVKNFGKSISQEAKKISKIFLILRQKILRKLYKIKLCIDFHKIFLTRCKINDKEFHIG